MIGKLRNIWEFFIDAGKWGVASELAALVAFCIGVWEHIHDKPVSSFVFVGLSVLLFWLGAFAAWSRKKLALEAERDRQQQPDVGLIWDWSEDERKAKNLLGLTEKSILVHNRSGQYVYNVRIDSIGLHQTLTFDDMNEIGPGEERMALGRWNGRSSQQTNYIYFFTGEDNEKIAGERGWIHKKPHNRGLSDSFFRVPMALTYESNGTTWRCEFEFDYEPTTEGLFRRISGRRV